MNRVKQSGTSNRFIYTEVRHSIISGHSVPGERLDLEALSAHYGTSITPVRDALQMLSNEGLVTIKARSGYFVTRVTLKQLRDKLELRKILELAAVERAVPKITDEILGQLENVHAGYVGEDAKSYDRYMNENRQFHCLIAQASGNQELTDALGRLHDQLVRFMVMCRVGSTLKTRHAIVIEALRKHDVDTAIQAMRMEVDATADLILQRVIQEEGGSWHLGV